MAYYFIKLYHEILNDYKMCRMSDTLWRRSVEFFLLAGENEKNGLLPPMDEICFRLRQEETELKGQIDELIKVKILHESDEGLVVTHFAKRQEAVSVAERKRQQRKRDREASEGGHAPVTNCDKNKSKNQNQNNNKELSIVVIRSIYENNIGPIVPITLDLLKQIDKEYSVEWFEDAVKIAVERGSRNLGYVNGILKKWKVGGKGKKKSNGAPTRNDYLAGDFPIEH